MNVDSTCTSLLPIRFVQDHWPRGGAVGAHNSGDSTEINQAGDGRSLAHLQSRAFSTQ